MLPKKPVEAVKTCFAYVTHVVLMSSVFPQFIKVIRIKCSVYMKKGRVCVSYFTGQCFRELAKKLMENVFSSVF